MTEKTDKVNERQNDFLKPCPFCGYDIGKTETQPYWDDFDTDDNYYVIKCGYCGAMMYNMDRDEVIASWNTRAIKWV